MPVPVFLNSKMSMVFAAGVILATALFASVFEPVAPIDKEREAPGAPQAAVAQAPVLEDQMFLEEMPEENLIDDTIGFDPALDAGLSTFVEEASVVEEASGVEEATAPNP